MGFNQPVSIIPNGVDVPGHIPKTARGIRTLLFLGRIHPVKGVDSLLRAWAEVSDGFQDWRLLVVGTDAGYSDQAGYLEKMKSLATRLGLKRVEFADPLYGEAKWSAYGAAELFVLPSHSENFGITVAEALAAGTPAIVTRGAPWSELDNREAGWWIDDGVEALVAALKKAMALPPAELARRGANGSAWMTREFSWSTIGSRMDRTYRWLTEGGPAPSWVRLD
jgi:glycosyltransferase involved in cell wall biosynthesis